MKTALIAGASGLVGKECLYRLLEEKEYSKVTALVRKPLHIKHGKLEQVAVEFDELEKYAEWMQADDIFCCLGTTIRKAKTKANFMKVDLVYPLKLAEIALKHGASQFLLVSSMGASRNSRIFYSRVKGELEQEIGKLGYESLHIFRPSMLLGHRNEFRAGELIGKWVMKAIGILFIGPLKRYKAIPGAKVASAMVKVAGRGEKGKHIYLSDEVASIADS